MKKLFCLGLMVLSISTHAELFKWKDADGNIIYSDQPPPNGNKEESTLDEKELPPLIETPALVVTPQSTGSNTNADVEDVYESIEIINPVNGEEAIRQNEGNIAIQVAVKPRLLTQAGDLVVIYIDDKEVFRGPGLSVKLENVDRGTHVINAEIISAGGRTLKKAKSVTFTLQRFSALF